MRERTTSVRLRLGTHFRVPLDPLSVLDDVLRAEPDSVALFQWINGVRFGCVFLAADSPEQVARFSPWVDPQLFDCVRSWRLGRRLNGDCAAARRRTDDGRNYG